jgi:hypothetical protein
MSKKDYGKLLNLFKTEVPFEFLEEIVNGFLRGYKDIKDAVYTMFPKDLARDLLPHFRRVTIDSLLLTTAKKYPNLRGKTEKNFAKNCSHVRIKTNSFTITANAVNYPSESVRKAKFRNAMAEANQLLLPGFDLPDKTPRPYFATILHGPLYPEMERLAFISLGFPSHDSLGYIVSPLDLAEYCNINLNPEPVEETIDDKAQPGLRKKTKIKKD